jgi:transcriptional regulator with XRE-family HTH domain
MFYQRLHKICKNKGITVTKMVKDLGLSSANMSNWKNGRLPKTEIAFKIANYLDISVYELMGEEEQETKNPSTPRDERIDDIYNIVKDLSETDMVALKAFAAGLKANRKSD